MVRFKMFTLTVALVLHVISPSGAFPFPSIPKLSSWFFRTDGPLGPCPSSCHCNGETASCFKPLPETEVPLPSTIESLVLIGLTPQDISRYIASTPNLKNIVLKESNDVFIEETELFDNRGMVDLSFEAGEHTRNAENSLSLALYERLGKHLPCSCLLLRMLVETILPPTSVITGCLTEGFPTNEYTPKDFLEACHNPNITADQQQRLSTVVPNEDNITVTTEIIKFTTDDKNERQKRDLGRFPRDDINEIELGDDKSQESNFEEAGEEISVVTVREILQKKTAEMAAKLAEIQRRKDEIIQLRDTLVQLREEDIPPGADGRKEYNERVKVLTQEMKNKRSAISEASNQMNILQEEINSLEEKLGGETRVVKDRLSEAGNEKTNAVPDEVDIVVNSGEEDYDADSSDQRKDVPAILVKTRKEETANGHDKSQESNFEEAGEEISVVTVREILQEKTAEMAAKLAKIQRRKDEIIQLRETIVQLMEEDIPPGADGRKEYNERVKVLTQKMKNKRSAISEAKNQMNILQEEINSLEEKLGGETRVIKDRLSDAGNEKTNAVPDEVDIVVNNGEEDYVAVSSHQTKDIPAILVKTRKEETADGHDKSQESNFEEAGKEISVVTVREILQEKTAEMAAKLAKIQRRKDEIIQLRETIVQLMEEDIPPGADGRKEYNERLKVLTQKMKNKRSAISEAKNQMNILQEEINSLEEKLGGETRVVKDRLSDAGNEKTNAVPDEVDIVVNNGEEDYVAVSSHQTKDIPAILVKTRKEETADGHDKSQESNFEEAGEEISVVTVREILQEKTAEMAAKLAEIQRRKDEIIQLRETLVQLREEDIPPGADGRREYNERLKVLTQKMKIKRSAISEAKNQMNILQEEINSLEEKLGGETRVVKDRLSDAGNEKTNAVPDEVDIVVNNGEEDYVAVSSHQTKDIPAILVKTRKEETADGHDKSQESNFEEAGEEISVVTVREILQEKTAEMAAKLAEIQRRKDEIIQLRETLVQLREEDIPPGADGRREYNERLKVLTQKMKNKRSAISEAKNQMNILQEEINSLEEKRQKRDLGRFPRDDINEIELGDDKSQESNFEEAGEEISVVTVREILQEKTAEMAAKLAEIQRRKDEIIQLRESLVQLREEDIPPGADGRREYNERLKVLTQEMKNKRSAISEASNQMNILQEEINSLEEKLGGETRVVKDRLSEAGNEKTNAVPDEVDIVVNNGEEDYDADSSYQTKDIPAILFKTRKEETANGHDKSQESNFKEAGEEISVVTVREILQEKTAEMAAKLAEIQRRKDEIIQLRDTLVQLREEDIPPGADGRREYNERLKVLTQKMKNKRSAISEASNQMNILQEEINSLEEKLGSETRVVKDRLSEAGNEKTNAVPDEVDIVVNNGEEDYVADSSDQRKDVPAILVKTRKEETADGHDKSQESNYEEAGEEISVVTVREILQEKTAEMAAKLAEIQRRKDEIIQLRDTLVQLREEDIPPGADGRKEYNERVKVLTQEMKNKRSAISEASNQMNILQEEINSLEEKLGSETRVVKDRLSEAGNEKTNAVPDEVDIVVNNGEEDYVADSSDQRKDVPAILVKTRKEETADGHDKSQESNYEEAGKEISVVTVREILQEKTAEMAAKLAEIQRRKDEIIQLRDTLVQLREEDIPPGADGRREYNERLKVLTQEMKNKRSAISEASNQMNILQEEINSLEEKLGGETRVVKDRLSEAGNEKTNAVPDEVDIVVNNGEEDYVADSSYQTKDIPAILVKTRKEETADGHDKSQESNYEEAGEEISVVTVREILQEKTAEMAAKLAEIQRRKDEIIQLRDTLVQLREEDIPPGADGRREYNERLKVLTQEMKNKRSAISEASNQMNMLQEEINSLEEKLGGETRVVKDRLSEAGNEKTNAVPDEVDIVVNNGEEDYVADSSYQTKDIPAILVKTRKEETADGHDKSQESNYEEAGEEISVVTVREILQEKTAEMAAKLAEIQRRKDEIIQLRDTLVQLREEDIPPGADGRREYNERLKVLTQEMKNKRSAISEASNQMNILQEEINSLEEKLGGETRVVKDRLSEAGNEKTNAVPDEVDIVVNNGEEDYVADSSYQTKDIPAILVKTRKEETADGHDKSQESNYEEAGEEISVVTVREILQEKTAEMAAKLAEIQRRKDEIIQLRDTLVQLREEDIPPGADGRREYNERLKVLTQEMKNKRSAISEASNQMNMLQEEINSLEEKLGGETRVVKDRLSEAGNEKTNAVPDEVDIVVNNGEEDYVADSSYQTKDIPAILVKTRKEETADGHDKSQESNYEEAGEEISVVTVREILQEKTAEMAAKLAEIQRRKDEIIQLRDTLVQLREEDIPPGADGRREYNERLKVLTQEMKNKRSAISEASNQMNMLQEEINSLEEKLGGETRVVKDRLSEAGNEKTNAVPDEVDIVVNHGTEGPSIPFNDKDSITERIPIKGKNAVPEDRDTILKNLSEKLADETRVVKDRLPNAGRPKEQTNDVPEEMNTALDDGTGGHSISFSEKDSITHATAFEETHAVPDKTDTFVNDRTEGYSMPFSESDSFTERSPSDGLASERREFKETSNGGTKASSHERITVVKDDTEGNLIPSVSERDSFSERAPLEKPASEGMGSKDTVSEKHIADTHAFSEEEINTVVNKAEGNSIPYFERDSFTERTELEGLPYERKSEETGEREPAVTEISQYRGFDTLSKDGNAPMELNLERYRANILNYEHIDSQTETADQSHTTPNNLHVISAYGYSNDERDDRDNRYEFGQLLSENEPHNGWHIVTNNSDRQSGSRNLVTEYSANREHLTQRRLTESIFDKQFVDSDNNFIKTPYKQAITGLYEHPYSRDEDYPSGSVAYEQTSSDAFSDENKLFTRPNQGNLFGASKYYYPEASKTIDNESMFRLLTQIDEEVLEQLKEFLSTTKIDLPVDINDPYDLGLLLRHLRHHSSLLSHIDDPKIRDQIIGAMQEKDYDSVSLE
ncbi:uncharacterized protein [Apostichopus japonicus]|uniref:uncharacterized protein n=1 Tax=Stichopus japonicus TaxID=307972 RepID=UPI003AB8E3F0